jgi:hypothetical protein
MLLRSLWHWCDPTCCTFSLVYGVTLPVVYQALSLESLSSWSVSDSVAVLGCMISLSSQHPLPYTLLPVANAHAAEEKTAAKENK